MSKVPYTKPAKTYVEQLEILKKRGLKIESADKVSHLLKVFSYYRLSGYWHPLLEEPKANHIFKFGADFQTSFRVYQFDTELRLLILKELEKIEIAIRSQMTYILSHNKNIFWYTDTQYFSSQKEHFYSLKKLQAEYDRSDEQYIKNFRNKYSDPLPPSWMMLGIISFGTLSKLYRNLRPGLSKRYIAKEFGLDENTFSSWIHSFVYVRNVCAHHSRLWNKTMSIKPKRPLVPTYTWLNNQNVRNDNTYFILSMILYFLQSFDPQNQLVFNLKILMKRYPDIDKTAMGFPLYWENEMLWNFRSSFKEKARLLFTRKVD